MHGCTQNDGDINGLFGSWYMTALEVEGSDDALPQGYVSAADGGYDYLWSFQNNIVSIEWHTDRLGSKVKCYGTFVDNGDTLALDFGHSDDTTVAGDALYAPPAALGLTANAVLKFAKRSGDSLVLKYEVSANRTIIYTLKKTW